MTIIVGADLDGTLCWNQEDVAQYRPFKKHMWYKKCQPTKYSNYPSSYSPSNNATNVAIKTIASCQHVFK